MKIKGYLYSCCSCYLLMLLIHAVGSKKNCIPFFIKIKFLHKNIYVHALKYNGTCSAEHTYVFFKECRPSKYAGHQPKVHYKFLLEKCENLLHCNSSKRLSHFFKQKISVCL